jgi:hypothetical protein
MQICNFNALEGEYMLRLLFFSTFILVFSSACTTNKPSNAIEELGEQVIKKKEGIDIRLMPIEEEKVKEKHKDKDQKYKTRESEYAFS